MKWTAWILFLICGCSHQAAQQEQLSALFQNVQETHPHQEWKLANYLGVMKGDALKRLHVSYNVEKAPTLEEARQLLLEGIQQMLAHCPLSYQDLKYSLAFKTPEGKFVGEEHIAHAFLFNGVIYYSIFNEKRHGLEVCAQEPFPQF